MNEVALASGLNVSPEDLRDAMNAAFCDYQIPMHLTPETFSKMMRQRGFEPNATTVAFLDGQIAAFWLMSVRGNAAYLISSGTRPEFRGKGISTRIAYDVLNKLRAAHVPFFQTEVLENNEIAQQLYARIGMTRQRHLGCCTISQALPASVQDIEITQQHWPDIQEHAASMRDWLPSWQHSDASLAALNEDVVCYSAAKAGHIVGVCSVIKGTNTLAQIAVKKENRRQGIGRALVQAAVRDASQDHLRVINFSTTDTGFAAFLKAHHAQPTTGQFELGLHL